MGADVRAIKNRIRSIESTLHITKAMQLVASSKIKRATTAMNNASDFAAAYKNAYSVLATGDNRGSVFLKERNDLPVCYVIICADRGLAGGYNGNVYRFCAEVVKNDDYIVPIGKRAVEHFKKRYSDRIITEKFTSSEKISDAEVFELSSDIIKGYREGRFGRVRVISTEFVSIVTQEVRSEQLLPISLSENSSKSSAIYEPDPLSVMNYAIKGYLSAILCSHIRESYLSELYARRNAMDNATENAEEMIEEQNLIYNRARQSNITQEITEIVAGAEDR